MGYEYYGTTTNTAETVLEMILGFIAVVYIIALAISIFSIVCMWKVFKKAGKEGWAALIPIYNIVVLIQIAGVPMWYIALLFIPIANVVATFLIYIELAKKFGQSPAFGVGLVFLNPIFMAMLAFGKKYTYIGATPAQQQPVYNQPMQNNSQVVYNTQQPVEQSVPVQPLNNEPQQENLQPQPTNCKNCGAPLNAGDKFCMNCGTQI